VSLQSIVQFQPQGGGDGSHAEIVVITHRVVESAFMAAMAAIEALPAVQAVAACLRTL
jgi:homoserine dehydrogenase